MRRWRKGGKHLAERENLTEKQWLGPDYQIMRRIGAGGNGTVYLVKHLPTEQLRAAKALDADTAGRAYHELNIMKRLRHPSLPQVYDVLKVRGKLWLILEYIHGRSLAELRGELRIEDFFSVARQLAEVLRYLHTRENPILHLDIKPTNIMIRQNGQLLLIDFGAAAFARPESGLNIRCGTPGFAAPEQKDPESVLDVQADFYGLGAVLYYCLYGNAPKTERKKFTRRKPAARRLILQHSMKRFLERCLQPEPEKRFRNDEELYHSLCRVERDFMRRRQARRVLAAVLFLSMAVFFAFESLSGDESDGTVAEKEKERKYEELLRQADRLGDDQAFSCYEAAAALCTADTGWCADFLDRTEADLLFSLEEEEKLKRLFFTVPPGETDTAVEILEREGDDFAFLEYRIGIVYWYFYEGNGGKSAAAHWFGRAAALGKGDGGQRADSAERVSEDRLWWVEEAKVYARIGEYYEGLGRQDANGRPQVDFSVYWEDLICLWRLEEQYAGSESVRGESGKETGNEEVRSENVDETGSDTVRGENGNETGSDIVRSENGNETGSGTVRGESGKETGNEAVRREIAKEILACLILQSYDLAQEGKSLEEVSAVLDSVEKYFSEDAQAEEECRESFSAAAAAVQRAWMAEERGNEFAETEM